MNICVQQLLEKVVEKLCNHNNNNNNNRSKHIINCYMTFDIPVYPDVINLHNFGGYIIPG